MLSWLRVPDFPNEDDARRARQLYRMLAAMVALTIVGFVSSLLEPRNDVGVSVRFYGIVLSWLLGVGFFMRRGRVRTAGWVLSIFFWLLIALVTILFGGLQ